MAEAVFLSHHCPGPSPIFPGPALLVLGTKGPLRILSCQGSFMPLQHPLSGQKGLSVLWRSAHLSGPPPPYHLLSFLLIKYGSAVDMTNCCHANQRAPWSDSALCPPAGSCFCPRCPASLCLLRVFFIAPEPSRTHGLSLSHLEKLLC